MNKPPQANRGFDQWVFYFRSGESISVAADEGALRQYFRRNRLLTAISLVLLAAVLLGVAYIAASGLGHWLLYTLAGIVAVLLLTGVVLLRGLQHRLDIAALHPIYFTVDGHGITFAGEVRIPWNQTLGVLSADLRAKDHEPGLRLGSRLARFAGASRANLYIGLVEDAVDPLPAGTKPPLRHLITRTTTHRTMVLPLDPMLTPDAVANPLVAVPAAAHVAGRKTLISTDRTEIEQALARLMQGEPPIQAGILGSPGRTQEGTRHTSRRHPSPERKTSHRRSRVN